MQPVQRRANVFDLAPSLVVLAFAQASAPKVETQRRKSKGIKGLHGVVHNFVVDRTTIHGVRMADQHSISCVGRAVIQQRFQLARWALKKERFDSIRHPFLLSEN
jgi:hypothetical protein